MPTTKKKIIFLPPRTVRPSQYYYSFNNRLAHRHDNSDTDRYFKFHRFVRKKKYKNIYILPTNYD